MIPLVTTEAIAAAMARAEAAMAELARVALAYDSVSEADFLDGITWQVRYRTEWVRERDERYVTLPENVNNCLQPPEGKQ
jgi:hypothetical protein